MLTVLWHRADCCVWSSLVADDTVLRVDLTSSYIAVEFYSDLRGKRNVTWKEVRLWQSCHSWSILSQRPHPLHTQYNTRSRPMHYTGRDQPCLLLCCVWRDTVGPTCCTTPARVSVWGVSLLLPKACGQHCRHHLTIRTERCGSLAPNTVLVVTCLAQLDQWE